MVGTETSHPVIDDAALAVLDVIPTPVSIFDLATLRFLAVNEATAQELDYSIEDLLQMTISDLRPPEDVPALQSAVAAISAPVTDAGRWRLRTGSGGLVKVSSRWRRVSFQGREAVLATWRDVLSLQGAEDEGANISQERKVDPDRAQATARLYRALFEAAPSKLLVMTPETYEIVAANDAYLAATNCRSEAIRGRSIFDVFPDDPSEPGADGVRNLRASLRRVEQDWMPDIIALQRYPIPRPAHQGGGFEERFWSQVNAPVLDPDGRLVYIIQRIEDVTELAQAGTEEKLQPLDKRQRDLAREVLLRAQELGRVNTILQEQAARIRTAERLLHLGTWTLDLQNETLDWSERVRDLYGVPRHHDVPDFDEYVSLVHPEDRDAMVGSFHAFIDSELAHFEFQHRILRADGEIKHVKGMGERHRADGQDQIVGVVQGITEYVAAEERLSQASGLMKMAGYRARLGGWRVELTPERIQWTDETAAIHEEPAGTQPTLNEALAYYEPWSRELLAKRFDACVQRGVDFDEVLQLVTANGNQIWVRAMGEPVRNSEGAIVAIQGAIQDITEMVEAQEKVAVVSRQLRETLENMGDAFYMIDHDWRFSFVNKQAGILLQCRCEDLIGRGIWDAFPEAVDTILRSEYERVLTERVPARFEVFYPPLDRWFNVSAHPAPNGIAVYFNDVTERKRADEAIRIRDERFHLLSRATNDVIWDWDLDRGSVWRNEALPRLFSYDRDAIEHDFTFWANRLHADDRDRVVQSVHETIDGSGSVWTAEYRFLRADGTPRQVADRGFVIRDADGKAVRMIGSMIDVTEQRALEERYQQSQKLEAVGQLTGGVAHDFNNLLTIIMGNTELLQEGLEDQHALRRYADMSARAADRAAELTNRLLAFSRKQTLQPKVTDLNAVIAGLEGMLRRTLGEDINIEIVRAGGLWRTEVDVGQVEAALLNLANNARDAMPGGGSLTIETANASLDDHYASTEPGLKSGQYVVIAVSDTGCGIPGDHIDRVFDPFFTTKPIGKGTGLGLSMVYGLVKQSGGHIRIYSEPDEGTTVKLYFPRYFGSPAPTGPGTKTDPASRGQETILVVEDDDLILKQLAGQLSGLGYTVLTASEGVPALAILRERSDINLLFTDVVLPGGMSGRQIADAALIIRPGLKVLFTSGYSENAIVHHGRLDPGVELLSKPYRRSELATKVRKVLES